MWLYHISTSNPLRSSNCLVQLLSKADILCSLVLPCLSGSLPPGTLCAGVLVQWPCPGGLVMTCSVGILCLCCPDTLASHSSFSFKDQLKRHSKCPVTSVTYALSVPTSFSMLPDHRISFCALRLIVWVLVLLMNWKSWEVGGLILHFFIPTAWVESIG